MKNSFIPDTTGQFAVLYLSDVMEVDESVVSNFSLFLKNAKYDDDAVLAHLIELCESGVKVCKINGWVLKDSTVGTSAIFAEPVFSKPDLGDWSYQDEICESKEEAEECLKTVLADMLSNVAEHFEMCGIISEKALARVDEYCMNNLISD
ncbi:hypothetical protein AB4367_13320 [Vibrio breoganii]